MPNLLLVALALAAGPAPAAFERLLSLVGVWRGTYEWSGARTGSGDVVATYSRTGNGSALVEDLDMGSGSAMTSVYHLDQDDLRVTHFCAAGNQPRLRAERLAPDTLHFALVDVTNLRSAESGHVDAIDLRFLSADEIELTFGFRVGAARASERLWLRRQARLAEPR